MDLFNITLILFLIIDPLGNIATLINLLKGLPPIKQKQIIVREMFIALAVMLLFNYIGEFIFSILNLSEVALRISSGAILFLVAIKTLFPALDSPRANLPTGEPFITPIAIPLIASPSLLATIMLFAHLEPNHLPMLAAIFISWASAFILIFYKDSLKKVLTLNGLISCEKLMGMILLMLAIQRILEGLEQIVKAI